MREIPVSVCESNLILKCIKDGRRINGEKLLSYRPISISFGLDFGYCVVCMGETKIMAQVSAEMDRPKESRASEGNLGIFVEMSTMGAAFLDPAKPGNLGVELQRMLERSLLLSRSVDLEELCVRVGEHSWNVSLRLQIISHDGNLLDCASIAALTALAHFKRPDVTVVGKEVTVHTLEEKNPVPLTINHQPFCVTFACFDNGNSLISDPNFLEEKCSDGKLMVVMNKHKEICCTQMSGRIQISKDQVLKCTNLVAVRVKELSELVKKAIENDAKEKRDGQKSSVFMSSPSSSGKLKQDLETNSTTTIDEATVEEIKSQGDAEQERMDEDRSQRLCWLMKHGQNTVSAVEEKVRKTHETSDVASEQMNVSGSDSEEEEKITMKLA